MFVYYYIICIYDYNVRLALASRSLQLHLPWILESPVLKRERMSQVVRKICAPKINLYLVVAATLPRGHQNLVYSRLKCVLRPERRERKLLTLINIMYWWIFTKHCYQFILELIQLNILSNNLCILHSVCDSLPQL